MQEVVIVLTVEKVNVVLQALAELPFKFSAELIDNIRKQAQEQLDESLTKKQD